MQFDDALRPYDSAHAAPRPPIRAMAIALVRAVEDLTAPPLRRVVWLSLLMTVATFIVLWGVVAVVMAKTTIFAWGPLDMFVHALGIVAVVGLSWLLFPAVATMLMGWFFERIAAAVEARHHPDRGPPRRASFGETARTTLRLMGLTIFINILALPVYVLAPGLNFFVFLGLNGYLFGREYFEVVALRRLDPVAARTMRRRYAGRIFAGGIAIAGLFAVPLVNFVAPVLAIALMVHLFEALRPDPQFPAVRTG